MRSLYKSKRLTMANVDCFVKGFKKAQAFNFNYVKERAEYYVSGKYRKEREMACGYSGLNYVPRAVEEDIKLQEEAHKLILQGLEMLNEKTKDDND